jgi:CRP/FNR family transcriptional regulator
MLSTAISEVPLTIASTPRFSSTEAGRQRQGSLWSSLQEVCEILQIAPPFPLDSDLLFQHIQYKKGQRVHAVGKAFDTLHVLRSGFIKTRLFNDLGNEQVLSFPMRGDILGIDGIGTRRYASEAIALTDCDLILVPYKALTALGRAHLEMESVMCRAMSRELAREQQVICMMRGLRAEARVARFLLSLADRFAKIGYPSKQLHLKMTRQEIGNYLGITVETVSRTLSLFNDVGLITLDRRTININEAETLRSLRRLAPTRIRGEQSCDAKQKRARAQHCEGAIFSGV